MKTLALPRASNQFSDFNQMTWAKNAKIEIVGGNKYHQKTLRSNQIWCSTWNSDSFTLFSSGSPGSPGFRLWRIRSTRKNPAIQIRAGTVRYHVQGSEKVAPK